MSDYYKGACRPCQSDCSQSFVGLTTYQRGKPFAGREQGYVGPNILKGERMI